MIADGVALTALKAWIRANRPDLDKELSGLLLRDCREILNRETGLNVGEFGDIEESAQLYLDVFKGEL